jgi:hypothetical protein
MIKIGQFSTFGNASIFYAAKIGLHLKNQRSEKILSLQKRFCSEATPSSRVVFSESLLILFSLGKISFDAESDRVVYSENN